MFRFFILVLVLLIGHGLVRAQTVPGGACPEVEIGDPNAKNTSVGHLHYISPTFRGASTDLDLDSLKYKWTLPDGFAFEGQGRPYISFFVTDAMDGQYVKVALDVEGLPANCGRTATTTFRVEINWGSPLTLDEYDPLSLSEERVRLKKVKERLGDLPKAKALVLINYKRTDSAARTRSRAARITSILSGQFQLPKQSLAFVFAETEFRNTRIYAWIPKWPPNVYSATDYVKFGIRK